MVMDRRWRTFVLALVVGCGDDDGSGSGGSDGASDPLAPCEDPETILQAGVEQPSGFVRCADSRVVREAAVTCTSPLPPGNCTVDSEIGNCRTDADCGPGGACLEMSAGPGPYCQCVGACATDADCGDGRVCACAGVTGTSACVVADCTTNADCGDGLCRFVTHSSSCDGRMPVE